ncbi:hypothetical protein DOU17_09105 [Clavibacter michiganensis subsp. michiganensis]|uniref:YobI family P-loop NTPase n=1 Tax=Clavibacter michiganensis TaxID=28447 RepID=UPI000B6CF151|nr:hypothetical protein [Clavibacter michiganensis]MWJ19075.1 hypothetical protein [Clavibacter michiganensis subsp. michiganensis]OUD99510.1 hypothetical protein CMMCAS06_15075 [Clavibacter michiganensis subsp. michiganensis]OUE06282.1 hypothetical protein CMMCAS08_05855 [Clavibacter michiganensis subsp. michiganensis]
MTKSERTHERALHLEALAPEFSESDHGMYLDTLERAIDEQPEARNIALAGAYGVGKSSVLGEFADRRKNQVIEISLLTLGVEPEEPAPGSESNPNAFTTSNRIQKEIVKQLLYQHSPARTRLSRFRRIVRPGWKKELSISGGGGLLILVLLFASGLLIPAGMAFDTDIWSPPSTVRLITFAVATFFLAALLVYVVRLIMTGRVGIEKVAAGPATITLPSRSTSYFDEYLDEIIYFFEVASRRDIVIIEDLDRFNDPGIYESLRSLNGLLNSAQQLHGRNIRFVYAVRDSIFEGHGLVPTASAMASPGNETDRGNRTKFFELIIPMVPFITHKNARDLLHQTLAKRGHTIERQLVDLAARHVPDMRLIHNIVNEYEVFKHKLLDAEPPVPGLDAERLFSMVLFKNTQAADFEAIRRGDSSLDRLFKTWRELVGANVDRLRQRNNELRLGIEQDDATRDHAAELGRRLEEVISVLAGAPGSMIASTTPFLDGNNVDAATMRTVAFWLRLRQKGHPLILSLHPRQFGYSQEMSLDAKVLEALLGKSLDSAAPVSRSVEEDQEEMRRNAASLDFLQRHTWKDIVERDEFVFERDDVPALTFRRWTEGLLFSPLAVDLVTQGYITSYFPLHVSSFYGKLIRPNAMTYVMRNVNTGIADPEYLLDSEDVQAIVDDYGEVVLRERSMRNVSLVDHLLFCNADAAETVIQALPGDGDEGIAFIHRYLTAGRDANGFIAAITPHWPSVFDHLVSDASLTTPERVDLFSVAMDHRADRQFARSDEVTAFVTRHAADISALSEPTSERAASRAVQFVAAAGAVLPDTSVLSEPTRHALRGTRAYEITAPNIEALSGSANLSLDALQIFDGEMYEYVISEPDKYVTARVESADPGPTVEDPASFSGVVQDASDWSEEAMAVLIHDAEPGCRIAALRDAPLTAWSTLALEKRTDVTLENVQIYVQKFGEVDASLANLLSNTDSLTWDDSIDEAARAEVSLQLINANGDLLPDGRRVALAASLDAGQLSIALVEPRPGKLIGLLIEANLIADDEDAFSSRQMVDWRTQEFAITKSARFDEFVGPDTLSAAYVGPLMSSDLIQDSVRTALISHFDEYGTLPPEAYRGIASAALRGRVGLTATQVTAVVQGARSKELALELLAHYGDNLPLPELRQSLRSLGGNLAVVADKGWRSASLKDAPEIRVILKRLQEGGIVSRIIDSEPGVLKVTLRRA